MRGIVAVSAGLLLAAALVFWLGTECGRHVQVTRDRQKWIKVLAGIKEIRYAMAYNFEALKVEIARAVALLSQPKADDPTVQASIDDAAAQLKAANDAAQPPA